MKRRQPLFGDDKRRKHHHFLVTIYYKDGDIFGRTYTDYEEAVKFAKRQKKSPLVERTRITQTS